MTDTDTDADADVAASDQAVRDSDTGRRLSDSQFDEAWHIVNIIRREIKKTTSFVPKLTDYAHAFSRDERFDAARGTTILRRLYTERYGETMNETREAILDREDEMRVDSEGIAKHYARAVLELVEETGKIPFWRALDQGAVTFAKNHRVSEGFAKAFMRGVYWSANGRDLYEAGKELEDLHYRPKNQDERSAKRDTGNAKRRPHARNGPSR